MHNNFETRLIYRAVVSVKAFHKCAVTI